MIKKYVMINMRKYQYVHLLGYSGITLMAPAIFKKYQSTIGNPYINGILVLKEIRTDDTQKTQRLPSDQNILYIINKINSKNSVYIDVLCDK